MTIESREGEDKPQGIQRKELIPEEGGLVDKKDNRTEGVTRGKDPVGEGNIRGEIGVMKQKRVMRKCKNEMKEIVEIEGGMIIGGKNMKMIESKVTTETGLMTGEGMSVPEEGKITTQEMIMEEERIGGQGIEIMRKEMMKDIVVIQADDLVREREATGRTEDRVKKREEIRTGEVLEDLGVLGMKGTFITNK